VRFQTIETGGSLPGDVDDKLRRFLDYWRSKGQAGRLPQRRDIDPLDVVRLLSSVFLLDVEADDFRFSLVGQDVADRHTPLKGKSLRELMSGPELEEALDEHRLCVRSHLPVYSWNTEESASAGNRQLYQRLLTPLASDADTVTSLAGIMVFRRYRGR
jgi:hypothetical protein